jgi:hypothetical protein
MVMAKDQPLGDAALQLTEVLAHALIHRLQRLEAGSGPGRVDTVIFRPYRAILFSPNGAGAFPP